MINNEKEPDVRYKKQLGYSRKNPNRGGGGYGISRGIKEIARGISGVDQEKIMSNFHGSFFLALEFLRDLGNKHNCVEYPGVELCFFWNLQG